MTNWFARWPGLKLSLGLFVVVAALGAQILAIFPDLPVRGVGFDIWQLDAVWIALVSVAYIGTRRGEQGHRLVWAVLVGVLLFVFLENYASYVALQDRLKQLHGDVLALSNATTSGLQAARYDAQALSDDVDLWTRTPNTDRADVEARVSSNLANLAITFQTATNQLQALQDRLTPPPSQQQQTVPTPQPPTLSQSTMAAVRNLAADATQETPALTQQLNDVQQMWDAHRNDPDVSAQLQYAVNPRLWVAIDTAYASAVTLNSALTEATTIPVTDLFTVIAAWNITAVLLPWLLLLLFIEARRDLRLRQIYVDLWSLGGCSDAVLKRSLDISDDRLLTEDGYSKGEVRTALQDQTFSKHDYWRRSTASVCTESGHR